MTWRARWRWGSFHQMFKKDKRIKTMNQVYPRYTLTPAEEQHIQKTLLPLRNNRLMPKFVKVGLAAKVLLETHHLLDKVADLREKRGYQLLQDDAAFQFCWEQIEAAGRVNDPLKTLELALAENMRLTHEVNTHLAALGQPLMKVYQA
jgi:hypothetical protein